MHAGHEALLQSKSLQPTPAHIVIKKRGGWKCLTFLYLVYMYGNKAWAYKQHAGQGPKALWRVALPLLWRHCWFHSMPLPPCSLHSATLACLGPLARTVPSCWNTLPDIPMPSVDIQRGLPQRWSQKEPPSSLMNQLAQHRISWSFPCFVRAVSLCLHWCLPFRRCSKIFVNK